MKSILAFDHIPNTATSFSLVYLIYYSLSMVLRNTARRKVVRKPDKRSIPVTYDERFFKFTAIFYHLNDRLIKIARINIKNYNYEINLYYPIHNELTTVNSLNDFEH